jgi:hypothetical protein
MVDGEPQDSTLELDVDQLDADTLTQRGRHDVHPVGHTHGSSSPVFGLFGLSRIDHHRKRKAWAKPTPRRRTRTMHATGNHT